MKLLCALLSFYLKITEMTKSQLLFLLLLFSLCSSAKERTDSDMKRIAMGVLNQRATTRGVSSELTCISETETYRIYGYDDSFAIISRDDNSDALLGYSFTPFDPDNIPCGLKWWLSVVDATLQQKPMSSAKAITRSNPVVVEPLITAKWGQGDPYNLKCPTFKGKNGPVGCVATAMSQLMYYYKFPETAKGSGYYTLGDASQKHSVTINSTYDWSQFKDVYTSSWFITEAEKQNISQLCYDAGVATHMNYASDGSGSQVQVAANALGQIFNYDSLSVKCVYRDYCSEEEWLEVICNEFINGRPIIIGGQDKLYGGHAFILDGINADGLIHVNWGWNGDANGYYNISDLNPSGILGSSSVMHFNFDQTIITNLKPRSSGSEGGVYRSFWAIDGEDDFVSDQMNGILLSGPELFWQYNHLTFYGKVGVRFVDGDGKESLFATLIDTNDKKIGPVDGGHGYYVSYFNHVTASDLASLPAGTYTAYLASKAIQDEHPQYICYPGGKHNSYTITKADDGSLTITKSGASGITMVKNAAALSKHIYDLRGRNLGTDASALPKGIYIIDGKKVVK